MIKRDGRQVVVGVVSTGFIGCASQPKLPGIYTRVNLNHYLEWIKSSLEKEWITYLIACKYAKINKLD